VTVYSDVSDPNASTSSTSNGTYVTAISAEGTTVAGYYFDSSDNAVGFVENVGTGAYTDVSDPNVGRLGTFVTAISADGATVAGFYDNSSGNPVGFVENVGTGAYTDVSGPIVSNQTYVTAISADGATVAGSSFIGSSDNAVGFVENVGTGAYTEVSDPNGSSTIVTALSADGTTVAGYYVNSSGIDVGYIEDVGTGAYTNVSDPDAGSDPNGLDGTYVSAVSADGATVAGYYVNSSGKYFGFLEKVGTGDYTNVSDPNGSDTTAKAISADGTIVAGNYFDSSDNVVGFAEKVGTGAYTDISDPNSVDKTLVTAISADGTTVAGQYHSGNGNNWVGYVASDIIPCFCRGTRILTERGELAVEALAIGDVVLSSTGQKRNIKWIGHRLSDCLRHPDPPSIWPVCVSADAFGENIPSRDLWLSPGHSVATEGVLIPIKTLLNGKTVTQHQRSTVEYWHVELHQHDIILAEGLPAESYLDCGNRSAFANGGAFVEAHPDFKPKHWAETCLPLVKEGPAVATTKALLLGRLSEQGHLVDRQAGAHIVVDGVRVEPIYLSETRLAFVLPLGGREIVLRSKVFVPAETIAESADSREIGLCVGQLQIDGSTVALADDEPCGSDWHVAEAANGRFSHRWTKGATPLPTGAQIVIVDLAGIGHYWCEPKDRAAALSA
jgi:uncharacterized membrane protein